MKPTRIRPEISWGHRPLRSVLFAPGSDSRKIEKVGTYGADAVALDLEDAVANSEKSVARDLVTSAVASFTDNAILLVRLNNDGLERLAAEMTAVIHPNLDGVLIPKTEDPQVLESLGEVLSDLETRLHLAVGSVRLVPMIETALGVVRCEEIALSAPERVATLTVGSVDLANSLNLAVTPVSPTLRHARARVVVACGAGALLPPIDGPFLEVGDREGLVTDTRRSRLLGFGGRVVVHPCQVAPVQREYSYIATDDLERSRRIVEAFTSAEAEGNAAILVDGLFVDYPIFRRAVEMLRAQGESIDLPS